MSEIEERDLDWVWFPYLARGEVTILQGDPEAGKSFIAQNISGHLCGGAALPCHVTGMPKVSGRVIYFDLENSAATVTRKRMRWNGYTAGLGDFYQEEQPFSIDDEDVMEDVMEALERVRPVLVVFDTLMTYIGKADTNTGASAQQSFVKFKEIAARFNCAVLVLRHLTKGGRDKAMYRGQGNVAFTGIARIEITAGPHPTEEGVRVMARSKGNLTARPPSLTYEIIDRSTADEREKSKFVFGDFDGKITAEDLVAVPEKSKDDGASAAAAAFIAEALADGPVDSEKMHRMADARSIGKRTLQRAAETAQIRRKASGFGKDCVITWSLK